MGASFRFFFLGSMAVTVAAAAAACAANGEGSSSSLSGAGGGAGAASASSSFVTTGSGGAGTFVGSSSSTPDPDAACGLLTQKATGAPVDLYITVDKSSSMAGDKWDGAKAGLSAFANDTASAGLTVALDFFPHAGSPTCDQTTYETPAVAFGKLPGNAAALDAAMAAAMPDGFSSPVYTALGGAILAAKNQTDAHPGDAAAVLLVTDGAPMGPSGLCGGQDPQSAAVIAQLAAAGLAYGVKTFVVGLSGVDVSIADQIAMAGGTDAAILVATGDVALNFANALAKVRGDTLPCEFDIPAQVANGDVDTNHVNVLYTPGGGTADILPENPDCTGGVGWQYDDPTNPTQIIFCATSCQTLRSDFSAEVQILLGCVSVIH